MSDMLPGAEMTGAIFRSGAELLSAAMQGCVSPVPVFAQIHEFVAHNRKIPNHVFYCQPQVMVPAMLEVQAEVGLDVATLTYDIYNIEAQGLGQKIILSDQHTPDIDRSQPLVKDEADLRLVRTPDFASQGRFSMVVESLLLFQKLTGVQPALRFCAPFSLAANIRGIEQFILDIYERPVFARELLRRVTEEVLAPFLLFQKAHLPTAETALGADALASLPIVNIEILREWCAPYILQLRKLTGLNVVVENWVGERFLKDPVRMLDLKLRVAGEAIQGQDPDVEKIGAEFYKAYAQAHQVALVLGVGAAFLNAAAPQEISHRVQQYVQTGARGGRFALYLCNISASTPPENLRAAILAAHESQGDDG